MTNNEQTATSIN